MGQALYRDYRPKSFDDVIGQDHITKTLKNAVASGKISHAYLFTGPRGVGKTSVARILAHEVNQISYNDESIHLDIIEIDAASNRRIDEIRDLRDKVRIAPAQAKYKVYIIDEVHMLTREAFNALLKTLEEPPAHCIFILATTEAHKLPETIISRTQRFEFKSVGPQDTTEHLQTIAKQEKINITPEALQILAKWGGGSFRDSISYLDQLSSYGKKIEAEDVRNLLGLPAQDQIAELVSCLAEGDSAELLNILRKIEQQGVKASAVAKELSSDLRQQVIAGQFDSKTIKLLSDLLEVSSGPQQQERLEISLLDYLAGSTAAPPRQTSDLPKPATHLRPDTPKSPVKDQTRTESSAFDLTMWEEVVERSKKQAASVYTALRLAKPSLEGNVLNLCFEFPLHQKKLDQAKNKQLVMQIIEDVCGDKVIIETSVNKSPSSNPAPSVEPQNNQVNSISSIFGAAEVLEA